MKFADLHLHTFFSDGTFTPEELVGRASKLGFAAIAVTDHDTVEGCDRAAAACTAANMEFITGTELTAEHADTEVHILAYFVDTRNQHLLTRIAEFQTVRQSRIHEMVAALNKLGIPLKAESVFALANCKSPGRPHVARALVKEKLIGNLDEAFERYLKKGRPAWVPKTKMSALEGVELIHQAGGLAVMAHPGLNRTDEIIPDLVDAGLDGIECFHTKHSTAMAERYLEIAEKYHLLVTGGSDCHGFSKVKPLIGTVKLPYDHVEKLKGKVAERKAGTTNGPK
ncbi:MAG TPA: PHP domain-containing protein [Verrucomicrobiae bacterium]|nr:PHP domain-containing protein [Verrucomicrobiae bacterium]